MAESIIGLDFGSTGIKAVHLRRRLMGFEWVRAVKKDWPDNLDPFHRFTWVEGSLRNTDGAATRSEPLDSSARVIQDLWTEIGAGRARVIVSVPVHLCSIRTITLPFTDERRLTQVVPFEVEPQLPYSLEEVVVDYQPLYAENGRSRFLVAALPKEILNRYLFLLSRVGIEPSMVDLDALALYTLTQYGLKPQGNGPVVTIDIGASKTAVVVTDQGRMRFSRSFLHGSRHWTEAVAVAYSLSFEEAEQRKQQVGLDNGATHALSKALVLWMDELVRTIHVAQVESASGGQQEVKSVLLCGGGARLKGLEDLIAERLGLEVKRLDLPLLQEKGLAWDSVWSQALGLALKAGGVRQASRINFRKGEFAYRGEIKQSRRRTRGIGIGILLLLLLAGTDLALKYRIQTSRYNEPKDELRQMFREMFPEARIIVDEVHQAQTAVEALKKKAALFSQGGQTVLSVLGELAVRIPEEVMIEVQELVIEPERVRLEAETSSFEAVDRIKAAVLQSNLFDEAVVSNAKISANEDKVRFHLTLRVATGEESG